jgi:hypothetical protein
MDPDAIRAFAGRRWDLVAREKARSLTERYESEGPSMGLRVLAELRQRLQTLGTPPYTVESLREDLAGHVELAAKIARVRDGLARR